MAAVTFSQSFYAPGGAAAAGCKAYIYVRGTSTPRAAFTDAGLTTPATNPVIASTLGVQVFYLNADENYSIHVRSADDATSLMQVDYIADGGIFSIISYTIENVQFAEFSFTGDGSETDFTLPSVLAPSAHSLQIHVDGVYQKVANYSILRDDPDTIVTFGTAPPDDAAINIRLLSLQGQTGPKGDPGDVSGPVSSTANNIAVFADTSGGVLADGGKALPTGAIVGTSDTQTLTNKTFTSPVVNTPTGIVKGDVGLGNVDNTSDATKNSAVATLTNKTLTTPAINGGTVTPSATATATEPGYLGAPQRSISAADTFVISDAGKHLYHPAADTTARTWTIPANASVAYPIGTVIVIVNENGAGAITLSITSDTLRWGSSTGSRTIAANGVASLLKVTSTLWRLTGEGIS